MFQLNICLIINVLIFLSIPIQGEIVVRIESLDDFMNNGFQCIEGDAEVNNCQVKTAASGADLPSYFPPSFRALPGNENGKPLMYLESSNMSSTGSFVLVSSRFPVHSGTFVQFLMEYYTETTNTVGYMIFWADAGIGFFRPATNSDWKNDYSKYVARASFEENEVTYFLSNDRLSRFSVFRALEFIIDPNPQIDISITSLDGFEGSGAVCPNCRLGSVKSPLELPSQFPEGFRSLPIQPDEEIMFIDFQNTAFPTIIMADLSSAANLSCTGYVVLEPEFYNEQISSFGYGKTYNSWRPYGVSEPSTWSTDDSSLFHIDYYLMQGNREVGFHTMNDGFNKMSVFRKLSAKIYYYPQDTVNCDLKEKDISFVNNPFKSLIRPHLKF